ncbi:kinase suppressor of Ras 2-like isoform X2 [Ornithodoros turicata]|uniref:kinase suppressor of Ras 2-like isoform X2 n=1 Tax=Ornithodoros turicata TaxID=34597 RepID=UPI0031391BDD
MIAPRGNIVASALRRVKITVRLYLRLTRTLSTPKRCVTCNKMVYFTGIRCKQCGNISHESCANHTPHWCTATTVPVRRNSHQLSLESDEQEDDQKWRYSSLGHEVVTVSPYLDQHFVFSPVGIQPPSSPSPYLQPPPTPTPCTQYSGKPPKSPTSPTFAVTGLLKVVHWLSQKRKNRDPISKANTADKPAKSRFGLHHEKAEEKFVRKKLKSIMKSTAKAPCHIPSQTPLCTCPHRRVPLGSSRGILSPNGSLSSSGYVSSSASSAVQTPSDPELDARRGTHEGCRLHPHGRLSRQHMAISEHGRSGRQWMATKARTLSIETKPTEVEKLCATWPPPGRPTSGSDSFIEEPESSYEDGDAQDKSKNPCRDIKETLGEWCIPYSDLEFQEKLRHGRQSAIYRGRWHGEVLIYTFNQSREEEVSEFWEDVSKLSLIRHENIALFMGACVEPPHLAIITSMKKGPSLFEHIHIKRHHLSSHTKVNVARQIAQGMGYLHAKGIVHKNLTSKNVILESRVKVCIMDQGMAEMGRDVAHCGCLSRGHLTYFSPELMCQLRIEPPCVFSAQGPSQESDVYAFGTVLYELIAEKFPFRGQHPHCVIWQIASGQQQSLNDLQCSSSLKTLVHECWFKAPEARPTFSSIGRQLQENVTLHRRHSSSEPDRLHHSGLPVGRTSICS